MFFPLRAGKLKGLKRKNEEKMKANEDLLLVYLRKMIASFVVINTYVQLQYTCSSLTLGHVLSFPENVLECRVYERTKSSSL